MSGGFSQCITDSLDVALEEVEHVPWTRDAPRWVREVKVSLPEVPVSFSLLFLLLFLGGGTRVPCFPLFLLFFFGGEHHVSGLLFCLFSFWEARLRFVFLCVFTGLCVRVFSFFFLGGESMLVANNKFGPGFGRQFTQEVRNLFLVYLFSFSLFVLLHICTSPWATYPPPPNGMVPPLPRIIRILGMMLGMLGMLSSTAASVPDSPFHPVNQHPRTSRNILP